MVTMKKNVHYFPTVEWRKAPLEPSGWQRVTHEDRETTKHTSEKEQEET